MNEKVLVRNCIKMVEPDLNLRQVDYNQNPKMEAKGWDILGKRNQGKKLVGLQIKTREPSWWNKAGKDFPIEMYDGNRPKGLGWFPLYKNQNIAYMIFIWRSCLEQDLHKKCTSERKNKCRECKIERTDNYIQIYDNKEEEFFNIIIGLMKTNNYYPFKVKEVGRDNIMRDVGGCILPLHDIQKLLLLSIDSFFINLMKGE